MTSTAIQYLIDNFNIRKLFPLIIDIGAAEGKYTSNSYDLIVNHGWYGVLIEPQEQQILKAVDIHNDRVRFLCAAICEEDGETILFLHPNDGNGYTTENHGASLLPIPGHTAQQIVRSMSYDTLVSIIDFNKVGILSIDAEGYDFDILKGIFAATDKRPQVIIIETDYYLREPTREACKDFLKSEYKCIFDHEDQIYVKYHECVAR